LTCHRSLTQLTTYYVDRERLATLSGYILYKIDNNALEKVLININTKMYEKPQRSINQG